MENEIKRLIDLLHQTNPLSKDYSLYLEQIRELYSIYYCYIQNQKGDFTPVHQNEPKLVVTKVEERTATPVVTAKSEEQPKAVETKSVEPTPMAESVSATVVAEPTPVVTKTVKGTEGEPTTYTKEEVRALLSDASKRGIQIQPIISKFVPEGKSIKFSEVPASAYASLIKEIKNAG